MQEAFRIRVPASTSNIGPGFDTLGLALELFNEVEVRLGGKDLDIDIEGEGYQDLPRGPSNLFVQAIDLALKAAGKSRPKGLRIRMVNRIPLARGLGSSAATIISGLLAGQKLARKRFSDHETLELALRLEEHPDNLVAALVGGLSISLLESGKVIYMGLPVPLGLQIVMTIPGFKLSTEKARRALPKSIPFSDAVFNLSRTSLLTAALIAGRYDLLRPALQDRLHQPYRFELSNEMKKIFDLATQTGGCGTVMSGAGPSILTFVNQHDSPFDIVRNLTEALEKKKISAQVKIMGISKQGATVSPLTEAR